MPCMNAKGYFALRTHVKRREHFENAQTETKMGWGRKDQQRPMSEMAQRSEYQKRPEHYQAMDSLFDRGAGITSKFLEQSILDPEDFDPFWDLDDEFFDECS
jgi:hypothetical protein